MTPISVILYRWKLTLYTWNYNFTVRRECFSFGVNGMAEQPWSWRNRVHASRRSRFVAAISSARLATSDTTSTRISPREIPMVARAIGPQWRIPAGTCCNNCRDNERSGNLFYFLCEESSQIYTIVLRTTKITRRKTSRKDFVFSFLFALMCIRLVWKIKPADTCFSVRNYEKFRVTYFLRNMSYVKS